MELICAFQIIIFKATTLICICKKKLGKQWFTHRVHMWHYTLTNITNLLISCSCPGKHCQSKILDVSFYDLLQLRTASNFIMIMKTTIIDLWKDYKARCTHTVHTTIIDLWKDYNLCLIILFGVVPLSAFESLIMEADYFGSSTRKRITIR